MTTTDTAITEAEAVREAREVIRSAIVSDHAVPGLRRAMAWWRDASGLDDTELVLQEALARELTPVILATLAAAGLRVVREDADEVQS